MPKKIRDIKQVNYFAITGRLVEEPTKGLYEGKIYCDLKIKTTKMTTYMTCRVYGQKADPVAVRFKANDILTIEGVFVETQFGIEHVITSIDFVDTKGDLRKAEQKYKENVELYSLEGMAIRKYESANRTKK